MRCWKGERQRKVTLRSSRNLAPTFATTTQHFGNLDPRAEADEAFGRRNSRPRPTTRVTTCDNHLDVQVRRRPVKFQRFVELAVAREGGSGFWQRRESGFGELAVPRPRLRHAGYQRVKHRHSGICIDDQPKFEKLLLSLTVCSTARASTEISFRNLHQRRECEGEQRQDPIM